MPIQNTLSLAALVIAVLAWFLTLWLQRTGRLGPDEDD
jgi:hypothetical protein